MVSIVDWRLKDQGYDSLYTAKMKYNNNWNLFILLLAQNITE